MFNLEIIKKFIKKDSFLRLYHIFASFINEFIKKTHNTNPYIYKEMKTEIKSNKFFLELK